jgi:hypothetical protein
MFSQSAVEEAEEFLRSQAEWRAAYKPEPVEMTPLREDLVERIRRAFAGVTCYREVRVLLGGEAEDDYMSPEAQALLAPLEERDDWQRIPDDLLVSCSCALSYVGPHAYKFLLPRFMIADLQGLLEIYPGSRPTNDPEIYTRNQMLYLTEEQRICLEDFLNVQCVEDDDTSRDTFLPWEHDEYRTHYADHMDYTEYGELLLQRFREKMKL